VVRLDLSVVHTGRFEKYIAMNEEKDGKAAIKLLREAIKTHKFRIAPNFLLIEALGRSGKAGEALQVAKDLEETLGEMETEMAKEEEAVEEEPYYGFVFSKRMIAGQWFVLSQNYRFLRDQEASKRCKERGNALEKDGHRWSAPYWTVNHNPQSTTNDLGRDSKFFET
jgi:hypothetical protein